MRNVAFLSLVWPLFACTSSTTNITSPDKGGEAAQTAGGEKGRGGGSNLGGSGIAGATGGAVMSAAGSSGTAPSTGGGNGGSMSVGGTSVAGASTFGGSSATGGTSASAGAPAGGGAMTGGTAASIGGTNAAGATAAGAAGSSSNLAIGPTTLVPAKTGASYSATVSATGATSYTWSLTSGSLPAGITLTGTTTSTVTLSGAPKEAGLYPIQLTVSDGTTQKTIELSLAVTHRLAFLADRGAVGRQELYMTNVGAETPGSPVRLNAGVTTSISSFKWSPDGSRVAYLVSNELFVVNVANPGVATSAGTGVTSYAWLASGQTLAVATSSGAVYMMDVAGAAPWAQQAVPIPAVAPTLKRGAAGLVPSPVGRAVAFTSCVEVISPFGLEGCYAFFSHWPAGATPTATSLLKAGDGPTIRFTTDGTLATVVTGSAGTHVWELTDPNNPKSAALASFYTNLQIDPTSRSLFYTSVEFGPITREVANLYVNPTGTPSTTLLVSRGTSVAVGPWSPDGKNVLLTWEKDLRTIANAKSATLNADVSILPDGFLLNAFTNIPNYGWSPDSRWVALRADRSTDGVFDLYLARWPGPGPIAPVHATTTGAGVKNWKFAPNSSAVAFLGTNSATAANLMLSRLPTSGVAATAVALTRETDPSVESDFEWLPGSRMVLYRAANSGGAQLHGVHVSPTGTVSAPATLTGATTASTGVTSYQVAPLP